jgi:hypothetical protein
MKKMDIKDVYEVLSTLLLLLALILLFVFLTEIDSSMMISK